MSDIFNFTGICATLLAFIFCFYERWEKFATENHRMIFRKWLKHPALGREIPSYWPTLFVASFDKFFGERHLSTKCFIKSCVASFLFVAVVTVIFLGWYPHAIEQLIGQEWDAISTYFTLPIFLNVFPDYIALLKSRAIVHGLGTYHIGEKPPTASMISFDVISNFIISSTTLILFLFLTGIRYEIHGNLWIQDVPTPEVPDTPRALLHTYVKHITARDIFIGAAFFSNSFGIFFYSTFFTSLSIWFFVLARFGIRQLKFINEKMKFIDLRRFIDERAMDKEPIACFGFILACGVGLPVTIFLVVILIVLKYLF